MAVPDSAAGRGRPASFECCTAKYSMDTFASFELIAFTDGPNSKVLLHKDRRLLVNSIVALSKFLEKRFFEYAISK